MHRQRESFHRRREGLPRGREGSPRRREGSPRRRGLPKRRGPPKRGHTVLGKPGDSEDGLSGSQRRGIARLGEPTCHAPDTGPTRLANPNRFRGAKPYTGTPYFFFFFF